MAFGYCRKIPSIDLMDPFDLSEIPGNTFAYCPAISEVRLPMTLQQIGGGAFRSTSIKSIDLPAGLYIVIIDRLARKVILPTL